MTWRSARSRRTTGSEDLEVVAGHKAKGVGRGRGADLEEARLQEPEQRARDRERQLDAALRILNAHASSADPALVPPQSIIRHRPLAMETKRLWECCVGFRAQDLNLLHVWERRRATRSDVKNVTDRVVRRHGVSAVGDRLKMGAVFPRSASYAGTAIMGRHLRRWKRVESMSDELVAAAGAGTTLSDLADKIAAHDLDGMRAGTGYWCLHWARLFTEDFAGMKVPGLAVTVEGPCMRRLLERGEGAMALTLLGINRENVAEELPRSCVVMIALAARLECVRVVRLAQAAVLGGLTSDVYKDFSNRCIAGFKAARRHCDEPVLLPVPAMR